MSYRAHVASVSNTTGAQTDRFPFHESRESAKPAEGIQGALARESWIIARKDWSPLLRQPCDNAQRTAAATFDLHRQSNDVCSCRRELIERGDVFECGNVFREQNAVALEEGGLAKVDAGG